MQQTDRKTSARCFPPRSPRPPRSQARSTRGIALLLVTIGLVVCSILTAGFLASQGTSLGIARNEREAEEARAVAQSGIEMGLWLIKNRADWRTAMAPGPWLNSVAIAGGTVTLAVADGGGNSSFATDPRQSALLTSTGTYNGRTYTLAATVTPTGGGTVFQGGSFFSGTIALGYDSSATDVVDSYNSSLGAYNPAWPGANAILWSNLNSSNSIMLSGSTIFRGSAMVGPTANLSNAVGRSNNSTGPSGTAPASQVRYSGTSIAPNPASTLANRGILNKTGGTTNATANALYSSITLNNSFFTTTLNFTSTGVVRCTGGLTLNGNTTLSVQDGCSVILEVDGPTTISGNVQINGSGALTIVANNQLTLKNTANVNVNGLTGVAGTPANLIIMGTSNCTAVTIQNAACVSAAIYTPAADVQLLSTPILYGAVIGKSFYIDSGGQFHFDQALQSVPLHNLYGGSAPLGSADYTIQVSEGGALASSTTPPTVTIRSR